MRECTGESRETEIYQNRPIYPPFVDVDLPYRPDVLLVLLDLESVHRRLDYGIAWLFSESEDHR